MALELIAGDGPVPVWHHATNLALLALNTLLVTLLAGRLTKGSKGAPLVAGLLYGLHPALVEGVSFIACRFDLLCTTFLLLGLWADARVARPWLRGLCVGVAFLGAALCKEMAVTFPVVLVLLQLARRDTAQPWREWVASGVRASWVGALVAGLVYLGIRYAALGYLLTEVRRTRFRAAGARPGCC